MESDSLHTVLVTCYAISPRKRIFQQIRFFGLIHEVKKGQKSRDTATLNKVKNVF